MTGADDFGWEPSASIDRGALKGLPNNIDAEAKVLSAMLLSGEVVEEALVELMPDDFYRPSHKTIFVAMSAMYESSIPIDSISLIDYLNSIDKLEAVGGEAYVLELMGNTLAHKTIFVAMSAMYESSIPIDSISLIDYLNSIDKLEAVGGEAYVLELMGNTLALANWQHHAGIVRRDAMLREIIGATNQISALAYDAPIDTKEVIERAESMLLSVTAREVKSSYRELGDFMAEAYQEAEEVARAGGDVPGAPTGYPTLDPMLMTLCCVRSSGRPIRSALWPTTPRLTRKRSSSAPSPCCFPSRRER